MTTFVANITTQITSANPNKVMNVLLFSMGILTPNVRVLAEARFGADSQEPFVQLLRFHSWAHGLFHEPR